MNEINPTFFLLRAPESYQGCFVVFRLLINSFITSSMAVMENCLRHGTMQLFKEPPPKSTK